MCFYVQRNFSNPGISHPTAKRKKMKSEMREISPNFKCIAYESKSRWRPKKIRWRRSKKATFPFLSPIKIFWLLLRWLEHFRRSSLWNLFSFCDFSFLYTVPNLKTKKKNNACKDLRTFKAIKKEINREICQKLSTKQLGSKQKRSSFTFLWLIATILCLINQSLHWIPT